MKKRRRDYHISNLLAIKDNFSEIEAGFNLKKHSTIQRKDAEALSL
jgi:hypothetical protein